MPTSQNGYTANNIALTKVWTIPGTSRQVRLHAGDPGYLLVHFAAWFDKNIESVDGGILDDWGYAERTIRGSSTTLSNHASGTALDINAPRHPLGAAGTFTSAQVTRIRAQLKEYDGCIRWGGDYRTRKDEMHFEIVRDANACAAVARRLGGVTVPWPVYGEKSAKVKVAQQRLVAIGHKVEVDGAYGPKTKAAVAAFQRSQKDLRGDADGYFGPLTWALLKTRADAALAAATKPDQNVKATRVTKARALLEAAAKDATKTRAKAIHAALDALPER